MDLSTHNLRSTGWGRYIGAAFLAVWLTFWLVGEVVAIAFLVSVLLSVASEATGQTVDVGPFAGALTDAAAPIVLFFILFWLTVWTFGGWAAGMTFLRQVAGHDVVSVTPEGLRFVRRAGPFRRTRVVPRASIRRVRVRRPDKAVVVDTAGGTIVIADLGTSAERESLQRWLIQQLAPPDHARAIALERDTPPHEWLVSRDGVDYVMSSPPPHIARIHALIGWSVTGVTSLGWVSVLRPGGTGLDALDAATWPAIALTLLSALAAIWLTLARREWVLRPGSMRLRLSVGHRVVREQVFDRGSLEIDLSTDSDGDDHWSLVIGDGSRRRVLSRVVHDHYELLALGEWLGARTGFPFHRPSI
jgi:hypothetical protein